MIPCLRVKSGVRLDPLTPGLARILGALELAARIVGVDLTITCGREAHGPVDPHTLGAAVDVRVGDLTTGAIVRLHQHLRAQIGDLFYVQYETPTRPDAPALIPIAVLSPAATAPHFHIQVRRGTVYPPQDTDDGTVKA